jgi:hypothetical protein
MITEMIVLDLVVWGENGAEDVKSMHTGMEVPSIRMNGHVLPLC